MVKKTLPTLIKKEVGNLSSAILFPSFSLTKQILEDFVCLGTDRQGWGRVGCGGCNECSEWGYHTPVPFKSISHATHLSISDGIQLHSCGWIPNPGL